MNQVADIQSNYRIGYIKLYRSLSKKGWYKKSEYVHLWIHLLIKATHKGAEHFFNGKNIILTPGQFVTGRKTLSEETGIHESKIERILNFFEKSEQQIEQQKTSHNRLISILSWESYQESEQRFEQPVNNQRTTTEQLLNTYNNDKNVKNAIKEEIKLHSSKFKNFEAVVSFFDLKFYDEQKWLDCYDKLIRIDKFSEDDILNIVKEFRSDGNWWKDNGNFESLTKLRQKDKQGISYINLFNKKNKTNGKRVEFTEKDFIG